MKISLLIIQQNFKSVIFKRNRITKKVRVERLIKKAKFIQKNHSLLLGGMNIFTSHQR